MDPNQNKSSGDKPQDNKQPKWNIWMTLIITAVVILVGSLVFNAIANSQYQEATWTDFRNAMLENQLAEVEIHPDRVLYLTKEEAAKPAAQLKAFFTGLPDGGDLVALSNELVDRGVKINDAIINDNSGIIMILY